MKVVPITYHNKRYPSNIISNIDEIAGNLDKDKIEVSREYSLHTEYSHMKRKLDNNLVNKYEELKLSHKDNVPQLWKSIRWAEQFANFIIELVGGNKAPKIIEIHPPFNDYCHSFDEFFEIYEVFEKIILEKFPDVKILIENRCGTFYTGGKFLLSKGKDIVEFLESLSKKNIRLQLVLDYPQVFSAELIKMDNVKLDKILAFNKSIKNHIKYIGGFHIWGKKRNEHSGRWTPHNGDLNTFFSFNDELKAIFLQSIINTFDDDVERFFVPEVNSGEEDLQSIIYDLVTAGIEFPMIAQETIAYKNIVAIDWIDNVAHFKYYDSKEGFKLQKIIGLKFISSNKAKRCVGIRDLKTGERIQCPHNNIINQNEVQCVACKNRDSFKTCVMCKGDECQTTNSEALCYCSQEHYVYLAYFPGDFVKVGTAHYKKKIVRLQEQGALAAYIICKTPTGKIARTIEAEIVNLGLREALTTSVKMKHFIEFETYNDIVLKLDYAYDLITKGLSSFSSAYLLESKEVYNQFDNYKSIKDKLLAQSDMQLSLFGDGVVMNEPKEADPFISNNEVFAVAGYIALIKDDKSYKLINLKKLIGFEFESIES